MRQAQGVESHRLRRIAVWILLVCYLSAIFANTGAFWRGSQPQVSAVVASFILVGGWVATGFATGSIARAPLRSTIYWIAGWFMVFVAVLAAYVVVNLGMFGSEATSPGILLPLVYYLTVAPLYGFEVFMPRSAQGEWVWVVGGLGVLVTLSHACGLWFCRVRRKRVSDGLRASGSALSRDH